MTDRPLQDRIAVITGASAGIGESLARHFAARGCRLVINARRADRLEALARELGEVNTAAVPGDAADDAVITQMLDTARDRFGREADLVVVNAGRGLRGSVLDSDTTQWEQVIRINFLGAARLLRAATLRMETLQPPLDPGAVPPTYGPPTVPRDIIVLGSTVGRHISPFSSFYGSAKAAAHMLAESSRRLCAPKGIRVTLLEPGIVRSEFQEAASYDPVSFGKFMDSIGPVLAPDDISRLITFIVTQPAGVHINDVMIRPTRQEYP